MKCIDDTGWPSFVECEFVDIHGKTHHVRDKDAIFCADTLDSNSTYPVDGVVGCEVVEAGLREGRPVVKVTTEFPWHIDSIEGITEFEVFPDQLVELEGS
jgi:hypothetical protein